MPGERMTGHLQAWRVTVAFVPYASVSTSVRWDVLSLVCSMKVPKVSAEVDKSNLLPFWKVLYHPVARTQYLLLSIPPIGERQPVCGHWFRPLCF